VNWWEELRYDFKTIVSSGWSKRLIEDDRIKERFFSQDMEEIEELESRIAEVEGELNELLEEVEDWDEEEQGNKTTSKVKKHLKEIVNGLRASWSELALKEAAKWENLISRIEKKEKELKNSRKILKEAEKELENKIRSKIETLSEEESKEILLEKFYELIDEQLNRYLNAEKKEIIKIFEKLWDKYKVSLSELKQERDEEVRKLDEFLKRLRYYDG